MCSAGNGVLDRVRLELGLRGVRFGLLLQGEWLQRQWRHLRGALNQNVNASATPGVIEPWVFSAVGSTTTS